MVKYCYLRGDESKPQRDELIQSLITTQCACSRSGNRVQDEILAPPKTMLKLPIDYSGQVLTSSFLMTSLLYPQNCGIIIIIVVLLFYYYYFQLYRKSSSFRKKESLCIHKLMQIHRSPESLK